MLGNLNYSVCWYPTCNANNESIKALLSKLGTCIVNLYLLVVVRYGIYGNKLKALSLKSCLSR